MMITFENDEPNREPQRMSTTTREAVLLNRLRMLSPAAVARVEHYVAAEWEREDLERDAVPGDVGR